MWQPGRIFGRRTVSNKATNKLIYESHLEAETDDFGLQLAAVVSPGQLIALNGQLGSGKTRFVRALCTGLGINPGHVNSPTFVLMQLYEDGRIPVAHFDTYRLADVEEFLAIGADEFLHSGEYLCLIEWADRVADILPPDYLQVNIRQTGVNSRLFELIATGSDSGRLLQSLRVGLDPR